MVGRPLAQAQMLDWAQKAVVLRQIDAQPTRGPARRTWYGFDMAAEMSEDAETIANNHESVADLWGERLVGVLVLRVTLNRASGCSDF